MKKRKINTSIFLMEMIMVCGFLMISISLCVQGFAKAREISVLAEDKGNAVLLAQNLAEDFKSDESFEEIQEMNISVTYDKDLKETNDEGAIRYICKLHISDLEESSNIKEMNIGVYKGNDRIYDLTVSRFNE